MERQLRMDGGIMEIVPREPAIFGGIKKAIKKVGKTVKKVASSDIGKAALLYAGTAGLGALGAGQAGTGFKFLGKGSFLSPGNVLANLGATGRNLGILKSIPDYGNVAQRSGPLAKFFDKPLSSLANVVTGGGDKGTGMGSLGKLATLGLVSGFLTKTLGMTPEQAEEELARDPSGYLEQYYRNLNPPTADTTSEEYEKQVRDFVTTNTSEYAVGGRVGFAAGSDELPEFNSESNIIPLSNDGEFKYTTPSEILPEFKYMSDGPVLPPDPTQPVNPFAPKPPADAPVLPDRMASNIENDKILEALFEKYIDMGLSPKDAAEAAQNEFDRMSKKRMEPTIRGVAALGGRMNYSEGTNEISIDKIEMLIKRGADNDLIKEYTGAADGVIDQIRDVMERKNKAVGGTMDTASDNAMQAAGIEGLPVRQNPKGVKELDLRETGGFIPPVGIKEKEDDIPAMLSNNEFVFTADAVRGMGGGNVNKGAQMLYDQMKMLEKGGRVV